MQAVRSIAAEAESGDARLREALAFLAAGQLAQAEPLLQAFAETKTARIARDRAEAATAYRNLGAIAGLRDPRRALDAYVKAAELDPEDLESQFWAAWLLKERGDLTAADERLRHILATANGNDWLHFWARLTSGDIAVQRGTLPSALASYQASLAIAERLATSDPGNAGWQRDLSVSYNKIGDVQQVQGNLPGALASTQASLAIAERLATSDPGNAFWQRDLSISHTKIGGVQQAQGNLPAALASTQASLAIRERLARSDPGNADWQRDLAFSQGRVAAVLAKQGDRQGAIVRYRQAQQTKRRLCALSPDNAVWRNDLAFYTGEVDALAK